MIGLKENRKYSDKTVSVINDAENRLLGMPNILGCLAFGIFLNLYTIAIDYTK